MSNPHDYDDTFNEDEDLDYLESRIKPRHAVDTRRELERRMELRRLRELLDSDTLDDFE